MTLASPALGRFGRLTDAPATLLLAGVRVIDPADGSDALRDLAVVDGRLADPAAVPPGAPRIDGHGLVVTPGFCDLHVHLREPGGEAAEDTESGTRAAAKGGFTTVCAMPSTDPPLDEPARVAWLVQRAVASSARVRVVAAVTRDRRGERLTDLAELAEAGVVAFSDGGAAVADPALARAAMAYLAGLGLPLVEHAEDARLAAGGLMRAGTVATRLGLTSWPASAELTVVERDIALAAETGARVHFTHLSTAAALDAVRRAKDRDLPITCDVTPHHLALTDAWVAGDRRFAWEEPEQLDTLGSAAYDGSCRVSPPLPVRADALALLAGVADGSVDAIATDHAPHPPERTTVPFAEAAPGMVGLETALSLGLAAVDAGALSLAALIRALTVGSARVAGEERGLRIGQVADLAVFDPAARWRVERETLAGRSTNTPLLGRELPGVVRLTLAEGRISYRA